MKIDKLAQKWIFEAGEKIIQSFDRKILIETKSNRNDLVTQVDKEIEQFFIHQISKEFPDHQVLGEEGTGSGVNELKGIVWIIDPIDGTMNFVHQQRNFAISIGIYENGVGKLGYIYDVVHKELYHAIKGNGAFMNGKPLEKLSPVPVEKAIVALNATWIIENNRIDPNILRPLVKDVRGTRSYGSATLEIASVAAGRIDAYISLRLAPWDIAAGLILIDEVGGIASTLRGEPLKILERNSILVSKPGLHEKVMQDYLKNGKW